MTKAEERAREIRNMISSSLAESIQESIDGTGVPPIYADLTGAADLETAKDEMIQIVKFLRSRVI